MTRELTDTILRVVERAPDWIRRDLDSKDAVVRIRAEESLAAMIADALAQQADAEVRSEEHTSELQSLMRSSYAAFCLKKKTTRYRMTIVSPPDHNQAPDTPHINI